MVIFKNTLTRSLQLVLQNPGISTGTVLFGVAFALVTTNALYSQVAEHPAPIWKSQEKTVTHSVKQSPRILATKRVAPHKVLIQTISLKNIPVPTANPSKPRSFAAQSSLVREVQASLADVGIYKGKVDGIYGDETRRAIQEYQEKAGFIPDGEASFGLLANIKSAFAVAQVQKQHAENTTPTNPQNPGLIVLDQAMVSSVQSGLREVYGDEEIVVDGIFGNQTRQALLRFQKRFKIPQTGELDQTTLDKLREAGVVNAI
ncbi:MAG: peptidoglycan-binding protein [Pseudomonadota bacterium]